MVDLAGVKRVVLHDAVDHERRRKLASPVHTPHHRQIVKSALSC